MYIRSANDLMVEASGPRPAMTELGEQLAWIGGALRSSPWSRDICYCRPTIKTISKGKGNSNQERFHFDINFAIDIIPNPTEKGRCWQNMFLNPVVVQDFPVARRHDTCKGLEMKLNMMADLVRTSRASSFDHHVFLKGFSSMLVLTGRKDETLFWHLEYHPKGQRVSYLDHETNFVEVATASQLERSRHVVGWLSKAKVLTGNNHLLEVNVGLG